MENGSSYVLKEENLHQSCREQIEELWRQRSLCDVNLIVHNCDGKPVVSIPAHKLLLAATIPYFKAMFTSTMQESGRDEVILRDVDGDGLKLIISYVYSSKLVITGENAQGLLSTASLLGLPNVVSTCARYISKHITPANCLGILKFARVFSLNDLISAAIKFRMQQFAQISREDEFLDLPVEEVEELVSSDQITVDSEEDVYYAVARWIEQSKDREEHTVRLYNHVRFPILQLHFLNSVVLLNSHLSSINELKVMIQEALDYHDNPASVILFSNPKKTQPRSSVMGVVCLVGGSGDSGQSLMDVSFFNPHEKKWRMGPKMLQHRTRLALAMFNGELYAIGGADVTESLSSVEKYSPTTNSWRMVAHLKTARRSCAAVVTPFGIFVLGGYSGTAYLHSVEMYHAIEDEWTYQPAMSEARSDLCAVYFDQRVYAIGGVNSKEELRSVERFDILNRKWEAVASMNAPRANAGKVHIANYGFSYSIFCLRVFQAALIPGGLSVCPFT